MDEITLDDIVKQLTSLQEQVEQRATRDEIRAMIEGALSEYVTQPHIDTMIAKQVGETEMRLNANVSDVYNTLSADVRQALVKMSEMANGMHGTFNASVAKMDASIAVVNDMMQKMQHLPDLLDAYKGQVASHEQRITDLSEDLEHERILAADERSRQRGAWQMVLGMDPSNPSIKTGPSIMDRQANTEAKVDKLIALNEQRQAEREKWIQRIKGVTRLGMAARAILLTGTIALPSLDTIAEILSQILGG